MNHILKQFSTLLILGITFSLLFSSCCKEDDFTLSNLQICDQRSSDLGSPPECDSNMSTLAPDVDWITASINVHKANEDAMLTFTLFEVTNGANVQVQTATTRIGDLDGASDECTVVVAQSWPVTGTLPESDLEVRVSLSGDGTDNLTGAFNIRN